MIVLFAFGTYGMISQIKTTADALETENNYEETPIEILYEGEVMGKQIRCYNQWGGICEVLNSVQDNSRYYFTIDDQHIGYYTFTEDEYMDMQGNLIEPYIKEEFENNELWIYVFDLEKHEMIRRVDSSQENRMSFSKITLDIDNSDNEAEVDGSELEYLLNAVRIAEAADVPREQGEYACRLSYDVLEFKKESHKVYLEGGKSELRSEIYYDELPHEIDMWEEGGHIYFYEYWDRYSTHERERDYSVYQIDDEFADKFIKYFNQVW